MKLSLETNRPLRGTVKIDDSFWSPKLKTFFEVTLRDTFDKLGRDGSIENYKNLAAGKLNTHRGNPWHDGLLLETVRGAAYYLLRGESCEHLVARLDSCIAEIEKAQWPPAAAICPPTPSWSAPASISPFLKRLSWMARLDSGGLSRSPSQ